MKEERETNIKRDINQLAPWTIFRKVIGEKCIQKSLSKRIWGDDFICRLPSCPLLPPNFTLGSNNFPAFLGCVTWSLQAASKSSLTGKLARCDLSGSTIPWWGKWLLRSGSRTKGKVQAAAYKELWRVWDSLYLPANKLACFTFMDIGRRLETDKQEKKDFITDFNSINQNISSCSFLSPNYHRVTWRGSGYNGIHSRFAL